MLTWYYMQQMHGESGRSQAGAWSAKGAGDAEDN